MLFSILDSLLDKEIKIVSLYFLISSKSSESGGPIIIFAPELIISRIAVLSFSLSFEPESLGMIIIFLLFNSFNASCVESNNESPRFL